MALYSLARVGYAASYILIENEGGLYSEDFALVDGEREFYFYDDYGWEEAVGVLAHRRNMKS
jgi:hypothetical protein